MQSCEAPYCKNKRQFFVYQAVKPQVLADGSFETYPAGRSILVCGNHLNSAVRTLSDLKIKLDKPVKVKVL